MYMLQSVCCMLHPFQPLAVLSGILCLFTPEREVTGEIHKAQSCIAYKTSTLSRIMLSGILYLSTNENGVSASNVLSLVSVRCEALVTGTTLPFMALCCVMCPRFFYRLRHTTPPGPQRSSAHAHGRLPVDFIVIVLYFPTLSDSVEFAADLSGCTRNLSRRLQNLLTWVACARRYSGM